MSRKVNWSIIAIVLLAWVPTLGAPAFSALWQWSEVASSNGASDPQINFREGMPPSAVNDSSRALMAAVAAYRDDISGLLTTTGTASAYSVSTNQNLCASPSTVPQDGQQLALTFNLTNGAAPTLTADACSTYPIQSAPGVAVGAATLVLGSPYTFRFSVANSAWMLRDFYGNPVNVPVGGTLIWWTGTLPNSSWAWCNGQAISRTGFPQLFAMFGTTFGAGDGVSTFNLPDMREVVPIGVAGMGSTGGRGLISFPGFNIVGTQFGVQSENISQSQLPNVGLSVSASGAVFATVGNVLQGTIQALNNGTGTGGVFQGIQNGTAVSNQLESTGTFGGGTSSLNGGVGQAPLNIMEPSVTSAYIIRVM
jgi:microcystin-dependent protein